MNTYLQRTKLRIFYRITSVFVAVTFVFSSITPPSYAQFIPQSTLNLPLPGAMVPLSQGFTPALIKGITIDPDNPLEFDFIVNEGDNDLSEKVLREESYKMIKYFLASLTVPEEEQWVNLSPYEKNRIIPQRLSQTEMGRDLLAQDYLLKQLTASLIYPEDELGQKFWDRVYAKAKSQFGTTDIPMNTFNKVWIVPQKAVIYEHENTAFVVSSHLKVMLQEDYAALEENKNNPAFGLSEAAVQGQEEAISGVSSQVVREVLIPEIEKEVNEGENFANLRQVYNSMILATWFKMNLKESLLGKVYVDQNKIVGIDLEEKNVKQKIYDQYLEAFSKGVYDYIREEYDPSIQETIPRKYFSGGTAAVTSDMIEIASSPIAQAAIADDGKDRRVRLRLDEAGPSASGVEEARVRARDFSTTAAATAASPVTDSDLVSILMGLGFSYPQGRPPAIDFDGIRAVVESAESVIGLGQALIPLGLSYVPGGQGLTFDLSNLQGAFETAQDADSLRSELVRLGELASSPIAASSPRRGNMFSAVAETPTIAERTRRVEAERQRVRLEEGRFTKSFQTAEQTASLQEPIQDAHNISAFAGRNFWRDLQGHFRQGTTIGTFGVTNNVMAEATIRSKAVAKVKITNQMVREIIGLDASGYKVRQFLKDLRDNGYLQARTRLVTDKFLELASPRDMTLDHDYDLHVSLIYLGLMKNVWKHIQGHYNGGWAAIMKKGATDQAREEYTYLVKLAVEMTTMQLSHARAQEAAISLMGLSEEEEVDFRRSNKFVNFYIPIFMDIDEGHLKPQQLVQVNLTMQGGVLVAALHLEDQCHGAKKCGHMSGKALETTKDYIQMINMVQVELERLGLSDVLVVGRTDAEAAEWISGTDDARDQRFLLGVSGEVSDDTITALLRKSEKQIRDKVRQQVSQNKIKEDDAERIIAESLDSMENMVRENMLDENGKLIAYNHVITFAREVKQLEGADLQLVHRAWKELAQLKTVDEVVEDQIRERAGTSDALDITLDEWREFVQSIPFEYSGNFIDRVIERAEELGIIVHSLNEYRRLKRLYPETFNDGRTHVVWDSDATQMHDETRHYWMIKSGIPMAIARNVAGQAYNDVPWMEQHRANILEVMIWATALDQSAVDLLLAEDFWGLFDDAEELKQRVGGDVENTLRKYLVERRNNPSRAFEEARNALVGLGVDVDTALHLINSVSRPKANNTSPSFRWPFAKVGIPQADLEAIFDEIDKFLPSFKHAGLDAAELAEEPRDMTDAERRSFLDDQGVDVQFQFSTYFGELLNHVMTQIFNEGVAGRGAEREAQIRRILGQLFEQGYLRDGMLSVSRLQELGYIIDNAFTDNTQIFAGMVFDSLRQAWAKGEATLLDAMRGSGSTQTGTATDRGEASSPISDERAARASSPVLGDPEQVQILQVMEGGEPLDMDRFTILKDPRFAPTLAHLMEKFGDGHSEIMDNRARRMAAINRGDYVPGRDDLAPDRVVTDPRGNRASVREILTRKWKAQPGGKDTGISKLLAKAGAILTGNWTLPMAQSALRGREITEQDRGLYNHVLDALQEELPAAFVDQLDELELRRPDSGETVGLDEKVAYIQAKLKAVQEELAGTDKTIPVRLFTDLQDASKLHGGGVLEMAQNISDILDGEVTSIKKKTRDGVEERPIPPQDEWPVVTVRAADMEMFSNHVTYKGQPVPEYITSLLYIVMMNPDRMAGIVYPKLESPEEVTWVLNVKHEAQALIDESERHIHGIFMNETIESAMMLRLMLWAGRFDFDLTNVGRWDKGAADMRTFFVWLKKVFGDLARVGMALLHMDSYVRQNQATAVSVGMKGEGGMRVGMPSVGYKDAPADRKIITGIVLDVLYEWLLGYDNGWVASPSYTPLVQALYQMQRDFDVVLEEEPYDQALLDKLLKFPDVPLTREELKQEVYEQLTFQAGARNTALAIAIDSRSDDSRSMFDGATSLKINNKLWPALRAGVKITEGPDAGRVVDEAFIGELLDEVIEETMPRYRQFWRDEADSEVAIARYLIEQSMVSQYPVWYIKQLMSEVINVRDEAQAKAMIDAWLAQYNAHQSELFEGEEITFAAAASPVEEAESKIKGFIAGILGIEPDGVQSTDDLQADLDLQGLDLADLLVAILDEFGLTEGNRHFGSEADLYSVTVQEVAEAVTRATEAASSPIEQQDDGAAKVLAALTPDQQRMFSTEKQDGTDEAIFAKAREAALSAGLTSEQAQVWVTHMAQEYGLGKGKFVFVTPDNIEELKTLAREKGVLTAVGNGTDVANSHEDDVQRVPKRTGTVMSDPATAGKFNARKDPSVLREMLDGYKDSLSGEEDDVLYVIPYMMEPEGGIPEEAGGGYFADASIHITPDLYVAVGVELMVKHTGQPAIDRINAEGEFFKAFTNPGDLNKVKRAGDILIRNEGSEEFEKVTREGEYAIYDYRKRTPTLLSVFVVEDGKAVRKVLTDREQIRQAIEARIDGLDHVEKIRLTQSQNVHIVQDSEDERHILAIPELNAGGSIGTAFGGNAFINKKIEVLRINNIKTGDLLKEEGKYRMVAHMAIIEYTDPDTGETKRFGYEGPSNSGKTAFSTLDSPNIRTVSDDLALIVMDMETGDVYFAQPEGSIFAVMRNTNEVTNDRILKAVGPGTGTVFTNMAYNPNLAPNDRVWWGGLTPEYPHSMVGLRDYRNKLVSERVVTQAHVDVDNRFAGRALDSLNAVELDAIRLTMMDLDHANGRGTTRIENLPGRSENVNKWQKLDGILFGGRMEQPGKIPLVTHISDIEQAQHQRMFGMQVQKTAAEQGAKIGEFTLDPRAMKPFFGVRLSADANHQMDFWRMNRELAARVGRKPVEFFQGNWIHPKVLGMEGFQFPEDVVRWASQQIDGLDNFEETPVGRIPARGAFDLRRFTDITQDKVDLLRRPDLDEARANLEAAWEFATSEQGAAQQLDPAFLEAHNALRIKLGMGQISASSPIDREGLGPKKAGHMRLPTAPGLSTTGKTTVEDPSITRQRPGQTEERVIGLVSEISGVGVDNIELTDSLEAELGLSALEVAELLVSIGNEFDVGEGGLQLGTESRTVQGLVDEVNRATEASSPISTVGGIDLNADLLDLQIKRDGNGVPLPVFNQPIEQLMNIQGFLPVIINVAPVSVPLLLGLADTSDTESDFSFTPDLDPSDRKARFEYETVEEVSYLN